MTVQIDAVVEERHRADGHDAVPEAMLLSHRESLAEALRSFKPTLPAGLSIAAEQQGQPLAVSREPCVRPVTVTGSPTCSICTGPSRGGDDGRGTKKMLRTLAAAIFLAMLGAANAAADDWTSFPVTDGTISPPVGPSVPKTTLLGTEHITVACGEGAGFIPCTSGSSYEIAQVPISAFARSDRLDAVASSVSSLSLQLADAGAALAQIQATAIDFKQQVEGEMAASTSLVVLTPSAPGKTTMHLGYGHFGDQGAVGLTAAHRLNTSLPLTIDGGVSVTSSSDVVARAGVGVEF